MSIAMATYNGARFIQEQLNSILAQTHLPWELVITDDQSTDATEQIVNAFAEKAPFRIRFIRNEDRLYFSSNFMKAASLCEGDFIAFSDQDDIWDPRKIELSLDALAQPGVVLCVHDATKVNEQLEPIGLETRRGVPKGLLAEFDPLNAFSGFVCTFPTSMLALIPAGQRPADIIETNRLFSHDRWICFLATLVGSIANLPDPLALYRQHDDNAAGWMRSGRSQSDMLSLMRNRFGFYILKRLSVLRSLNQLAATIDPNSLDPTIFSAQKFERSLRFLKQYEEHYERRFRIACADFRPLRLWNLSVCVFRGAYRGPVGSGSTWRKLMMDGLGAIVAHPNQGEIARSQLLLQPK
ncbi:glycosyltransferase family 2 protein [Sphingomonas faeni]|uniref:glycosyltransferase family 2 protein n=1 Tax=Sphingomonas faeni TaxID=185950 RepID=UPI0027D7C520|nr:glycosyltransferase family 2 protein [Sphingomonas faeni]